MNKVVYVLSTLLFLSGCYSSDKRDDVVDSDYQLDVDVIPKSKWKIDRSVSRMDDSVKK